MVRVLKAIGGPGSIGFLAVGCAIGLVLGAIGPRSRRVGRVWLLVLYVSYVVAGIPKVAHAVAACRPAYQPLTLEAAQNAHTLIILAGDNSVGRLLEARRLLTAMAVKSVVVSGGEWMVEALVSWGVPRELIRRDDRSTTTREQIANLEPLMRRSSPGVVLVASRLQMARVDALVRAERLDVLLAPAPLDVEPPSTGWRSLLPRYTALRLTRDALYEYAALAYYSRMGWIGTRQG